MKKHIKLSLLCLLLIPFNNYASCEDKNNNDTSAINQMTVIIPYATGAATYLSTKAYGLSAFAKIASCKLATQATATLVIENESVQDNFAYTQEWYNKLNKKYPDAALDKKLFNMHPRSASVGWQATHNSIKCNIEDAYIINTIYEKKCKNEQLCDDESERLLSAEWIILHEAAHVNNQDIPTWVAVEVGAIVGIESLFHAYNKKMNINIAARSLPKRIGFCLAMIPLSNILNNTYSRMFEARADKYANEHADITTLATAKNWLNEKEHSMSQSKFLKAINTIASTHPSTESRIQAIDDEITRRAAQIKKESL